MSTEHSEAGEAQGPVGSLGGTPTGPGVPEQKRKMASAVQRELLLLTRGGQTDGRACVTPRLEGQEEAEQSRDPE